MIKVGSKVIYSNEEWGWGVAKIWDGDLIAWSIELENLEYGTKNTDK